MGDQSDIQWTDATLNPIRARHRVTGKVGWICVHKSAGCVNCYAEDMNGWRGNGEPFTPAGLKNVELFLDETILTAPLRWKKPRRIFVCSMTDLFWEQVPDEWIDRIFAVMALADRHTFQILTKRPDRMRSYLNDEYRWALIEGETQALYSRLNPEVPQPGPFLPNVHLGVSVENQATADERIPLLLQTPAAVRFLSVEPLLGPVDIYKAIPFKWSVGDADRDNAVRVLLHWVIVGGESGHGARPCDVAWIRSIVAQCKAAGTACFVKQLGSVPAMEEAAWHSLVARGPAPILSAARAHRAIDTGHVALWLRDRKGGDMAEWPEDLRVREFPR